ncbi:hypothetical protein AX774_g4334 [Zancudomyces culisetae]|uniref:Uncharacterized protein n=1 Tax=Zancudomyces culisetae TaxID=1213189 RepID=A0A1R1PMQ1_ZANCU|nr:hypothetical protein AX774_g4334 [Zancudomyces culisetae]|eukprot:OMH82193.1 hypothetical protein AX774_g4334 [Zancudomyces culisetae]
MDNVTNEDLMKRIDALTLTMGAMQQQQLQLQQIQQQQHQIQLQMQQQQLQQEQQEMFAGTVQVQKPHASVRPQVMEVEAFAEFDEAMPSTCEDFFWSYLTEDERKALIYESHKFKKMTYSPPAVNESLGASVKKADYRFYQL